jgi:hypothetical protein
VRVNTEDATRRRAGNTVDSKALASAQLALSNLAEQVQHAGTVARQLTSEQALVASASATAMRARATRCCRWCTATSS